ncbi:hypothetical protein B0H13DRAFT_2368304 [Mycena leptocephala]|nr:hypothetical protein B0H13DRAFT_2368304 [Mycena leptocephala]
MKLALTTLLAIIEVAVAQSYNWRLYNNGGCLHNSTAAQTFPPSPAPARTSSLDSCVTAPAGVAWNMLEVDISLAGPLDVFTFCGPGCTGAVLETQGSFCNSAPANCALESFILFSLS